jgi:hypothetical protein
MRQPRQPWQRLARGSFGVERLPEGLMPSREDRELLARILEKSPGRNQGRPLIGDRPQTIAERVARHRAKKKLQFSEDQLPATQRALPPGAAAPLPLGPAVPGISITEIEQMVANLLEYDLAERYHQYLGEVLDRLAAASPDYILTREEFAVVTAAGLLANRLLPKELH